MHHRSVSRVTNCLLFKVCYFLSLAIKWTFSSSNNKQRSRNRSIPMSKRSFLGSGKKHVDFSSPLGIADTKRFFHHGLLRSDFSSSLSFLSSTCVNKINREDTEVDSYFSQKASKPPLSSPSVCINHQLHLPLLSRSPCWGTRLVPGRRRRQVPALQLPPAGWGKGRLWAAGLGRRCQSCGCGRAGLGRSSVVCVPDQPGSGSGAWRGSGGRPGPACWFQGWEDQAGDE